MKKEAGSVVLMQYNVFLCESQNRGNRQMDHMITLDPFMTDFRVAAGNCKPELSECCQVL